MKKCLLGVFLLFAFILTSCSGKFDIADAAKKVEAEGYTIGKEVKTEEECDEFAEDLIYQMETFDDYIVEDLDVVYAVQYGKNDFNDPDYTSIIFIEFGNEDDVKEYYKWSKEYRTDWSLWRVTRKGNIIVDTNDESLHDIIGLKFE